MQNVAPYLTFLSNTVRACLFNILTKQPTQAAGKKIVPKFILVHEFTVANEKKMLKMISASVVI